MDGVEQMLVLTLLVVVEHEALHHYCKTAPQAAFPSHSIYVL